MLLEIILALICGVSAGTLTGLIPGLHINLVGVFLISLSVSLLTQLPVIYLVVFIASMAITHTFIDFIPSIFLGCPDTDTELSVLPGHELLKKGQGYEAVLLTSYGSIIALIILIIIAVPSILTISKIYDTLEKLIPYVLIAISLTLVLLEKKKITALFVLLFTGLLGWSVLNIQTLNQPLLPLLTGLFGSSMLIISIRNNVKIPEQIIEKPKFKNLKFKKPLLGSLISSPLCSFLPGLGSGQAAIIGNTISNSDKKEFLILLGATNTLVMGFSFISLYIISKTRTGAAAAIQKLVGSLSPELLTLIIVSVIISGIISFFLTLYLTKIFSKKIQKINYKILSLGILVFLGIVVTIISGFLGLIVFMVSTITGIYCISLGIRRTNMMGVLLLPTILLYLSFP